MAFLEIHKGKEKEGDPKTQSVGKLKKVWKLLERVGMKWKK